MPEEINQTNQQAIPSSSAVQQPTVAELQEKLKALKEEQTNFSTETDSWYVLEEKIKKIEEQLNKPQ